MEKIIHLAEVDSTNEYLKRNLSRFENGTLVWADKQTKGKGSNGRTFLSPVGGIYMSFLWNNPDSNVLPLVTPLAAVAVRRAILSVFHVDVRIKWVNDLLFNGKKVCGILCEKTDSSVVIGIGVNLSVPDGGFPAEISSVAGAICYSYPPLSVRETFAKRCYDELVSLLTPARAPSAMNEYALYSCIIGKKVSVVRGEDVLVGTASKINPDGSLVVKNDSSETVVCSGSLTLL